MMTKTQKAHAVIWTSAKHRVKKHYAKSERAKEPEVQVATGQLHPLVTGKEKGLLTKSNINHRDSVDCGRARPTPDICRSHRNGHCPKRHLGNVGLDGTVVRDWDCRTVQWGR